MRQLLRRSASTAPGMRVCDDLALPQLLLEAQSYSPIANCRYLHASIMYYNNPPTAYASRWISICACAAVTGCVCVALMRACILALTCLQLGGRSRALRHRCRLQHGEEARLWCHAARARCADHLPLPLRVAQPQPLPIRVGVGCIPEYPLLYALCD